MGGAHATPLSAWRAVVPVHQCRGDKAEREIHAHGDGEPLDRLPGLVQHGARKHRHQIGIGDGDGERRILGEAEILAGERRHDQAQRLRQHDQAQGEFRLQPERTRGFGLAAGHALNARAHDLGDIGGFVQRERQHQRDQLGEDVKAADEVEFLEDRKADGEGKPGGGEHDRRQPKDQRQPRPEHPEMFAHAHLVKAHPPPKDDGGDHTGKERDQHPPCARLGGEQRHVDAALVQVGDAVDGVAVGGQRQAAQDRVVPEEDLQQERHVAQRLDVHGGEPGDQPVLREPRDADEEAKCGRAHDAQRRHQKRVQDADDERAAVGRLLGVFDQRLGDAEASGVIEKAKTGGDVLAREADDGVARKIGDDEHNHTQCNRLEQDGARTPVAPRGKGRRRTGCDGRVHRTGGAYCSPPSFHNLFMPRSMPSGLFTPTVRS